VNFDDDGTDDTRQHNQVNEIAPPPSGAGIARTYDGRPCQILHDAARNLMLLEANDGLSEQRFTYDYRNRLIRGRHASILQTHKIT